MQHWMLRTTKLQSNLLNENGRNRFTLKANAQKGFLSNKVFRYTSKQRGRVAGGNDAHIPQTRQRNFRIDQLMCDTRNPMKAVPLTAIHRSVAATPFFAVIFSRQQKPMILAD